MDLEVLKEVTFSKSLENTVLEGKGVWSYLSGKGRGLTSLSELQECYIFRVWQNAHLLNHQVKLQVFFISLTASLANN